MDELTTSASSAQLSAILVVTGAAHSTLISSLIRNHFSFLVCSSPEYAASTLTNFPMHIALVDVKFGNGAGLKIAKDLYERDLLKRPIILFQVPASSVPPDYASHFDPAWVGFVSYPPARGELDTMIQSARDSVLKIRENPGINN